MTIDPKMFGQLVDEVIKLAEVIKILQLRITILEGQVSKKLT